MSRDDLGDLRTAPAASRTSDASRPTARDLGAAETRPASSTEDTIRGPDEPLANLSGDADTLAHGGQPASVGSGVLMPGASVGRYVVLAKLGAGGMGVVYSAYDPELDRKVAIKLLLPTMGGEGTEGPRRLLREAQAMAKLSHPCVVAVHDVGTIGGRVYVAMEFVAGRTMRQWMEESSRRWQDIVEVFIQAGRGLASAHDEGIVHRDFKPENVMVDDRGRVRVMDFGLAHANDDGSRDTQRDSSERSHSVETALSSKLTVEGAIMGTPAYMAPEQIAAKPTDARTDEFSYCVALWEALHGVRPFAGKSLGELAAAVIDGKISTPRSEAGVPTRIRRALERGLRADPDARWPSMNALLEELERSRTGRARWWLVGGAVAMAGTLGVLALQRNAPCTGAEDRLAGVWDDARREAVQAAMIGSGAPFAPGVWERVAPRIDAWAESWVAMHTDACEATQVRADQSEAVMDLRMSCLHHARLGLDAAAGVLGTADVDTVERAHEVVGTLPDLARCADVKALQADVAPPPPEQAAAVDSVQAELAKSGAHRAAGRVEEAETVMTRAMAALAEIAYEPLHTNVWLEHGHVLDALGRYDEAVAALQKSQALAARLRQWKELRVSTATLLYVIGARQGRHESALVLSDLALALAEGSDAELALVNTNLGAVLLAQGRHEEAEAAFRRGVVLDAKARGDADPSVAIGRSSLAAVLHSLGRYAEAEVEERAALQILIEALGARHPHVATARNNLTAILHGQGKDAEAELELREALAIYEEVLGPEHPDVATARNNLGVVLGYQGKDAEAEVEQRLALKLRIAALGPDHALVGQTRSNLAANLRRQGKLAEAEAEHRVALRDRIRALGPDHVDVGESHQHLATDLFEQGELEEAETEARAALAIRERALPPDHPDVARSLANLGLVLLERGEPEEALVVLERAHRATATAEVPASQRADSAFALAKAVWASGDEARARELAKGSETVLAGAGDGSAARVAEVRAWLRQHR